MGGTDKTRERSGSTVVERNTLLARRSAVATPVPLGRISRTRVLLNARIFKMAIRRVPVHCGELVLGCLEEINRRRWFSSGNNTSFLNHQHVDHIVHISAF